MKKAIFLAVGMVLILFGLAQAYDDGDFQVWNTEAEEFKIAKDAKIALEQEFRWGDDAREFYYQHYDIGYFYNLKKYLNVGGGYRHILSLQRDKWKIENEPYVTATLFWGWLGSKFEDRSRMEYRHYDYQADAWRYRNKFTAKLPWKFTRLDFQPFLSDEIFVRFGGTNQFSENRLSAGWGMNLGKNVKAEIYYLLDTTKNSRGRWLDANVLGSKVKIAF
jgi:hypothetical protein